MLILYLLFLSRLTGWKMSWWWSRRSWKESLKSLSRLLLKCPATRRRNMIWKLQFTVTCFPRFISFHQAFKFRNEDFIKQMSKELKWASSKMCDTSKSQMPIEIYIVKVFLYFYNLNFILFSNEINTCTLNYDMGYSKETDDFQN